MDTTIDYEVTIYLKNGEIVLDCITASSRREVEQIVAYMYTGVKYIEF